MDEDATDFWFGSGHVALDFSLSGGQEWRARWEQLHTPADLDAWFAASALGLTGCASTDEDLAAAYDLREGLWAVSQAGASGDRPPAASMAIVNEHARHRGLARRFTADGRASWLEPTPQAALATIANAAIELLSTEPNQSGLRRCEGERCHLLFLDTSPARRRRWCSMARCGNRHKVKAHRAKSER